MDERNTAPEPVNWTPQPYAERKSQNLSFGDFFMRGLFRILTGGAMGTAAGWAIDHVRAHKGKGMSSFKYWGGLIGALVGSYFTWNRQEKYLLQIDTLYHEYKNLPGLHPAPDELAADNRLLRNMVDFQRAKLAVSSVSSDGRVAEAETHHIAQ